MKTNKHIKHSRYILLVIILAMTVIISAWSIWFFPRETERTGETAFKNFTHDVLESFSVFAPKPQKTKDKINVDDVRSRVFGNTIKRSE